MALVTFKIFQKSTGTCLALVILLLCNNSCTKKENSAAEKQLWGKPDNFPQPTYNLSKNPLTREGIALGRSLFYDPVLSKNNSVSCGSCHEQKSAFAHQGQSFSAGIHGQFSKRNSPSIQNMAWSPVFFWDGGVHDLDFVPFNPVQNPLEMGENVSNVVLKLKDKKAENGIRYPVLFQAAFGTENVTSERIMKALSQFMVTIVSADSRYDRYVAGDKRLLGNNEKEGLMIFRKKCASCHAGELFTDNSFRNNGLKPMKSDDQGRQDVTRLDQDKYKFKVPSLRNVSLTAPYMHDGRFKTLEDVLAHYSKTVSESETLDSLLIRENGETGLALTAKEEAKVIAFLKTLTDENFLKNPTLANPNVSRIVTKK